jgi:4-amino-4-deoxy-L-arabinose transferase-like glycosyltransferase
MALAGAIFVLLYYILLRRLLDGRIALLSTLLLALNPFHIALSRVLHHDALSAMLMVLSLLSMVGYWLQGWKRWWLLISGALAGIAFMTKSVGGFMIPYALVTGMLSLYYRWGSGRWRGHSEVWKLAIDLALWGAAAGLAFVAFFPAMWATPIEVTRGIISTYQLAQEGHIHYFLGQISSDPGPLFYPIGWLLRASPLEVLGLLGLLIGAVAYFRSKPGASLLQAVLSRPVMLALAIFLMSFLLFMTVVHKKMVRYFLPAFPIISIFAATGLLWLADSLGRFVSVKVVHRWGILLLCGLILLVQGWLVLDNYPYYWLVGVG